jgi:hypothetical protein
MAANRCRVEVLCEDREHESFSIRLLTSRFFNVERRNIRMTTAPEGKGSAAAWVIKKYQDVVRRARATSNSQPDLGFLVVIDADGRNRIRDLGAENDPRAELRIAVCAPARNINTWVLWLTGDEVNEATDYKQRMKTKFFDLVAPAVDAWLPVRGNESTAVLSLSEGRRELENLPTG